MQVGRVRPGAPPEHDVLHPVGGGLGQARPTNNIGIHGCDAGIPPGCTCLGDPVERWYRRYAPQPPAKSWQASGLRLSRIQSLPIASSAIGSTCTHNTAHQQTLNNQAEDSYRIHPYDSLGQVVSGKR